MSLEHSPSLKQDCSVDKAKAAAISRNSIFCNSIRFGLFDKRLSIDSLQSSFRSTCTMTRTSTVDEVYNGDLARTVPSSFVLLHN